MKAINQAYSQSQIPRCAESVNRRSKETLLKRSDSRELVKKSQKIVGKSLSSAFSAVSEDLSPETKEVVDYSTESDVLTETWLSESVLLSPDPVLTTSPAISGTTSISSSINFTEDKEDEETLVDINGSGRSEDLKTENIDGQFVLDFLQEARFQVSKTSEVDLRSKKIFDAVIKILMEDFSHFPADRNESTSKASEKVRIGFLCFLVWSFTALVILLFSNFRARDSFQGLPPT